MRVKLSREIMNSNFVNKVKEISGEDLMKCYNCGKCSAGCSVVDYMDLLPNQVIRLVLYGQEDELLNSKTVWLCASCFTCTARCPKGVDLSKVMEAVRLVLLRKNIDHVEPDRLSAKELTELPAIALISNFRKFTA